MFEDDDLFPWWEGENDDFLSCPWWIIALFVNGVLGFYALEWAWLSLHRFRHPNKDLDKLMYMYERSDAKNWEKLKCYPVAMTLLLPRLLATIFSLIALGVTMNILLIGAPDIDKPLKKGIRKSCLKFWVQLTCKFHVIFGFWAYLTYENVNCNYEEYLGKQVEAKKKKPTSVIVCNHFGFFEIYGLLMSPLFPSFCAKADFKSVPFFVSILRGI